ncbi:DUF4249 family protein [Neolewinella persica]|uniref:DUF4249 family protein n=1 Tax=Neolewinella persica TaxID=70998 RepID=UPI00047571D4|nr:DUF4249 family protein [Neolewinella persica]
MKRTLTLCLLGALLSCADPVTPGFQLETGLYLIEGTIADQPGFSEVRVSRSELRSSRYLLFPAAEVIVSSVDEDGQEVFWEPMENTANFQPPADFAAETGKAYFIRVVTTEGKLIESRPDVVPEPVRIEEVRLKYEQEAYFNQGLQRFVPAITLLVDFQDPGGVQNFYQYRFRKWQPAVVCVSCPERFRYRDGECQDWRRNFGRWDYLCDGMCWNITQSSGLELFRDEFSNGNPITNIEVGRLDYVRGLAPGILFEAQMLGISKGAFAYKRVFKEQTEGGGGLNAANPTALVGNLSQVNEEGDVVLGYVNTAAVTTRRIYVHPDDVPLAPLANSFTIMQEPPPVGCDLDCPPLAPCTGPNRTAEVPEGWGR